MAITLLRVPMPDPLPPTSGRFRQLRHLFARLATAVAVANLSAQAEVDRRVRRGAVQALVRGAYQATVVEQSNEHRGPAAFAAAWRDHLASLLERESVEVTGWSELSISEIDAELAWSLFEAASQARQQTIDKARATPSRPLWEGDLATSTFTFAIVGDADEWLGDVKYGVCPVCRIGLLYNIGFAPDWQSSGPGRLALRELETRHPNVTWYTSGQHSWARGFYARYRQDSPSPWSPKQHPCSHFR